MPYHLVYFGDVPIPVLNPVQDHSPVRGQSTSIAVIGGYYDYRGAALALPQLQSIPVRGLVWGEMEYLVDETGDYLVDETGDFLIEGDETQTLRSQLEVISSAILRRDTLWRKRFDDDQLQWKTARFLEMSIPQEVEDRLFKAEVSLTFETRMSYWHAATATTVTGGTGAGVVLPLTVENAGQQPVDDAVLTILCTSGTIISLAIFSAAMGISLTWAGSLTAGSTFVLNCGEGEVPAGATDAFDGLTMQSGHSIPGWLLLPVGLGNLSVLVSGGSANVTLNYYEQFA